MPGLPTKNIKRTARSWLAFGSGLLCTGTEGRLLRKPLTGTRVSRVQNRQSPSPAFVGKSRTDAANVMPDDAVVPFLKRALENAALPGSLSDDLLRNAEVTHNREAQTIRLNFPAEAHASSADDATRSTPGTSSDLVARGEDAAPSEASSFEEQEQKQSLEERELAEYRLKDGEEYCPEPADFGADDDPINNVFADVKPYKIDAPKDPVYYPPDGAPGPTIKLIKASKVEIKLYEDGLTGWTIHGKGRVSSKFAFDVTDGYVKVLYDASGMNEPSDKINANFYVCAQDKDKLNVLTKKSTGEDVRKSYCDAQPKWWKRCEEWDIYESYGTKGGTLTMHTPNDGVGKPVGDHPQSKSTKGGVVFKWEGTKSGGSVTLDGQKFPYDHNVVKVNVAQVGAQKGWRTHSSMWTGWTKLNGQDIKDHAGLAKSVYKVRGFKGKWKWIAGTKPPKCDASGKVPKTADEKSTEAPSAAAAPAAKTAAEPTPAATPAPTAAPTEPRKPDDYCCAKEPTTTAVKTGAASTEAAAANAVASAGDDVPAVASGNKPTGVVYGPSASAYDNVPR